MPMMWAVTLERRRTGKPQLVQAQAERSARRLHGRWHALESRGKPRSIVAVAVARELAGHCWALATMELPPRPNGSARRAHRRNDARSNPREHCERENGPAPHFAHPVMRHQPAHMSRDPDVDDSRCAPPLTPTQQQPGRHDAARLTRPTPYERSALNLL
jgi:hypothetical protein